MSRFAPFGERVTAERVRAPRRERGSGAPRLIAVHVTRWFQKLLESRPRVQTPRPAVTFTVTTCEVLQSLTVFPFRRLLMVAKLWSSRRYRIGCRFLVLMRFTRARCRFGICFRNRWMIPLPSLG